MDITLAVLYLVELIGCILNFRIVLIADFESFANILCWNLAVAFNCDCWYRLCFSCDVCYAVFFKQFCIVFQVLKSHVISRSICRL